MCQVVKAIFEKSMFVDKMWVRIVCVSPTFLLSQLPGLCVCLHHVNVITMMCVCVNVVCCVYLTLPAVWPLILKFNRATLYFLKELVTIKQDAYQRILILSDDKSLVSTGNAVRRCL